MKKIFIAFLIFGFCCQFQFIVGQNAIHRPEKYDKPINPELPLNTDIRGRANWEVWSDRNNNPVYDSSNLSIEVARVGFMDEFYVIEANDHVLRIARKEDFRLNTDGSRSLTHGKTPVGWIHAERLLLWSVCLKADHNLDKKAMVLNNFRPDATIEELRQKPAYFGSPALQDAIDEVGLYEIGHVFKEIDNAVLIGSSWGIHSDAKREMRGWVQRANITPWNNRIAWEYNWHPDAVAQRAGLLNDKLYPRGAIIWENKADACIQGNLEGVTSNFLLVEKPLYEQREPGLFNRYPLLEFDADSKIARVGVIGTVVDKDGKEIDQIFVICFQTILEEILGQRNINILFVIDATAGIEHFSKPISQAIRTVTQELSGNTRNKYKFGVTLFRDEAERDKKFQSLGHIFTGNISEVERWLMSNMKREFNRYDRDHPEALFYGITESIDVYSPNKDETNYLILIGDVCDHECKVDPTTNSPRTSTCRTIAKVIDRLVARNINLMAFQARYMDEKTLRNPEDTIHFARFSHQIKEVLEGMAGEASEHFENLLPVNNNYQLIDEVTTNGINYKLERSPLTGTLNARHKGDTLSMNQLRNEVIRAMHFIETTTNEEIDLLVDIFFRGVRPDEDRFFRIYPVLLRVLEKILEKCFLDSEEYNEYLNRHLSGTRQLYREGYTCFQNDENLLPLFQPVILIENTDLRALRSFINQLARNEPVNHYRASLINILERTIQIYFGEMDDRTLRNLNFCELLRNVTGGCACKDDWEGITIGDIPALPSDMIIEIRDEFMETNRILTRIIDARDSYNGRIPYANTPFRWWWIPCDVFPSNPKPDDVSIDGLYLR
jgi:hypothetical protein